ncbi:hypothetical protein Hamer_G006310 [Homarus americanus]|uniref:Uncharacterized protein n=1 Tax=Homarus americanus TaxID=6706 RepID=A0A8J5MPQ1_HOMAM|nr:hypothetical protein Hamer_G006310 [Homarus americanus]
MVHVHIIQPDNATLDLTSAVKSEEAPLPGIPRPPPTHLLPGQQSRPGRMKGGGLPHFLSSSRCQIHFYPEPSCSRGIWVLKPGEIHILCPQYGVWKCCVSPGGWRGGRARDWEPVDIECEVKGQPGKTTIYPPWRRRQNQHVITPTLDSLTREPRYPITMAEESGGDGDLWQLLQVRLI